MNAHEFTFVVDHRLSEDEVDGLFDRSGAEVRPWFALYAPLSPVDPDPLTLEHDRLIAVADHLVRARALKRGDHLADGLEALVSA